MSEPSEIQQNITEAQYAAASGTGNATITITNYYYREEARIAPADSADVADDKLPCPYRGLFHFGPGDAEYFFGRESFIKSLFQATQTRNFIPLLGASGSGKSSVVFAGLVPKLQQESHWQFTHFRPGSDPFHALALALVPLYTTNLNETERLAQARQLANYLRDGDIPLADVVAQIQQNYPSERVLVIADQFEELYTLCPDETIRRNFLDKLTTSPFERVGMVLVLTMRADFLGNALSYRTFADVLQNTDLKLGPMNREELTEVIEKPAQKLGVTFEAGLVERILDDVESEPGNLPLLEFALTELWQRRQGQQLTHLAYTEIGQVQGALARHANEEYDKLSEAQRKEVRRIFIQLVRPGEGTEDTRRLATKAELGAVNWALVKQLADARLVVTSRSEEAQVETVEVVHEALIRNWGELRGWMDTDRVFRAWQERLRGAMGQWQKTQGDEGSWLRGAALAEAEEQLKQRPEDISQSEQDFIRQSLQERERIKQAEAARRRREIRTAWGIAAGSLVAVVVSTGLGLMAWKQTQQAELNLANARGFSSLSLFDRGKELEAFVEAIKAGKTLQKQQASDTKVTNALQELLNRKSERNRLEGHGSYVHSVNFSCDGKTLVSGSDDNTIKLWNVETGQKLHTFEGHGGPVYSVNFSRDGKTLVSGSDDKTIKLWNVETGQEIRTLKGHGGTVYSVNFSPDGKTLVSGSDDKTIKLWNVEKPQEIRTLKGHKGPVYSVNFSRNGKTLVSGSGDKTIKLWNVEKPQEIRTLKGHGGPVYSVNFSHDGKTLVSGSGDKTIKLWNVEKPQEIRTLKGHNSRVRSVNFSPNGKTLVSGSWDNTIKLWNESTGQEILTLKGHEGPVWSVNFSPDEGKTLVSGSDDGTIKLWNVEIVQTLKGHDDLVNSVEFSRNGKTLVSGSDDGTIKLWDVKTGEEIRTLKGHDYPVRSVNFSPDGKTLVSGSDDKTITLWNVETGQEIHTLYGHNSLVRSVNFSPDGKTLVSGSWDGTIKLWNVKTGKKIHTFEGHHRVRSVNFSPDGKTLVSGSDNKTITLWNVETGEEIHTLKRHDGRVRSVNFSPDGKTLVSGSYDKTIKLWNVEKRQEIRTLKGHDGPVRSVNFSPDGKTLVSGSDDKTIKLWDVETGQEIRTLHGHNSRVRSVNFSPNGKTLVSGSWDNTIKLWKVETDSNLLNLDALMGRSCDWVRVYLHNPNSGVKEEDRGLCDGIGTKNYRTKEILP
ncbi:eIF2A-related protein [Microcystis aeruginosa]|uniref:nSTAND1 domain-containing NTPase n=1 Tax=Microcystis aeruginosa TaxID=1126 RepID=UPI00287FC730|nr:WD40 repeat domain-containing protein [Microcystis aeruginosa]WNF13484.1 WD40 repeat domain-containing protein [Microcystis aeruginosa NRERC-214]